MLVLCCMYHLVRYMFVHSFETFYGKRFVKKINHYHYNYDIRFDPNPTFGSDIMECSIYCHGYNGL